MKSPSGSNFPYYYKDGILHAVHFADYKNDVKSLLKILVKEEEFIQNQNNTGTLWIDCCSVKYSKEVFSAITSFMENLSGKITKFAFVGISFRYRWRINSFLKKNSLGKMQIRYFTDPEIAKTWLVGKLL